MYDPLRLDLDIPLGDPSGRYLNQPVWGRRLFNPIQAIAGGTGLIGGVASIFGASKQAQAAKDAAAIQSAAAAKAGQQVTDIANEGNVGIHGAADKASSDAINAARDATSRVDQATAAGNTKLDQANLLLDPYKQSGDAANATLQAGLASGGQFNKIPTAADIQIDPGFAARLQAQQTVIERSAAARGGAASGTALMDLAKFGQTQEADEYSKAFDRYRESTGDAFSRLNTVAGRGFDASGQEAGNLGKESSNLIGAGTYGGDKTFNATTYGGDKEFGAATSTAANANQAAYQSGEFGVQGANAQASGKIGAANAFNQGISGALNAVGTGAGVYNLLKNPAKPLGARP